VIFPKLSRLSSAKDEDGFAGTINGTLRAMAFIIIPMMVGLMCISDETVRLIYMRGDFGQEAAALTATALFFLCPGMIGYGLQNILSRAYFANMSGKLPLISGAVSIVTNIVLCAALKDSMGVGGLALASAMASTISAVILFVPMYRKNKAIIDKGFAVDIAKIAVSAVVMAVVVMAVKGLVSGFAGTGFMASVLVAGLAVATGVAVYGVLVVILKVDEARIALGYVKKGRK